MPRDLPWPFHPLARPCRRPFAGAILASWALLLAAPTPAAAFCGFYVAKADTDLFNEASKVVLVRDGDRTVLTMASDYQGEPEEFAMVVPVPTFIEREQIHVGNQAAVDHLDAYTAPRLVEYYDENPCRQVVYEKLRAMPQAAAPMEDEARAKALGVTIEASYTVGEYDILILSAEQSDGLETWLRESGYRIPDGASEVLGSYLKQGMHFFVAKVNLGEQERLGFSFLRPLQVAYETRKFMLPIRLGTVNARGPQELFVFALTREGRVETTNYRTVKLPSGMDVPLFVEDEFGDFYKALFSRQVEASTTCAPSSSSTPGTWPGATRARPSRWRATSSGTWGSSGWKAARRPSPWAARVDASSPRGPGRRPCRSPRTSSSPASTCATTGTTSRRTSCSRPPATGPTSRVATCCATRGPAPTTARPRPATARSSPSATSATRRLWQT